MISILCLFPGIQLLCIHLKFSLHKLSYTTIHFLAMSLMNTFHILKVSLFSAENFNSMTNCLANFMCLRQLNDKVISLLHAYLISGHLCILYHLYLNILAKKILSQTLFTVTPYIQTNKDQFLLPHMRDLHTPLDTDNPPP